MIADTSIKGLKNAVVGANEADYHLQHVDVQRDLAAIYLCRRSQCWSR